MMQALSHFKLVCCPIFDIHFHFERNSRKNLAIHFKIVVDLEKNCLQLKHLIESI